MFRKGLVPCTRHENTVHQRTREVKTADYSTRHALCEASASSRQKNTKGNKNSIHFTTESTASAVRRAEWFFEKVYFTLEEHTKS